MFHLKGFLCCNFVFLLLISRLWLENSSINGNPHLQINAFEVCNAIKDVAISGSVYVTTALTIDRCYAVMRPLSWPSVFTRFRIKVILTAVSLWCVVFNIPAFLSQEPADTLSLIHTKTHLNLTKNIEFDINLPMKRIIHRFINPAINTVIPVLLVMICNCLIVANVKCRNNAVNRIVTNNDGGIEENKLTVQILCISIITLLSRVFYAAATILWMTTEDAEKRFHSSSSNHRELHSKWRLWDSVYKYFLAVSYFFMIVNSAANFIFYCYFGKTFRKVFFSTVCCHHCGAKVNNERTGPRRIFTPRQYNHQSETTEMTQFKCCHDNEDTFK